MSRQIYEDNIKDYSDSLLKHALEWRQKEIDENEDRLTRLAKEIELIKQEIRTRELQS